MNDQDLEELCLVAYMTQGAGSISGMSYPQRFS